jgi:hypothetical protein
MRMIFSNSAWLATLSCFVTALRPSVRFPLFSANRLWNPVTFFKSVDWDAMCLRRKLFHRARTVLRFVPPALNNAWILRSTRSTVFLVPGDLTCETMARARRKFLHVVQKDGTRFLGQSLGLSENHPIKHESLPF